MGSLFPVPPFSRMTSILLAVPCSTRSACLGTEGWGGGYCHDEIGCFFGAKEREREKDKRKEEERECV